MNSTTGGQILEVLAREGGTYEPRERAVAFARRHGAAHAALALYAALPLGLTPDLVHLLRVNFVPAVPWIAEADLLLSPLCRESGGEYYEMDARVRELLLDEFIADENFGIGRLRRAAEFLYVYAHRALKAARRRDARAFWQAQEWTALAYARPSEAARVLASELGRRVEAADTDDALRVARVTHALAAPLGAHDELVLYAAGFEQMLGGGDDEAVFELFDAAGANERALRVAGVTLPATQDLARRLGLRAPRVAPTPPHTPAHADERHPPGLDLLTSYAAEDYVTRLAWSSDGKLLAAPASDLHIYTWEKRTAHTYTLTTRGGMLRQVVWSPDGKRLAAITDKELLVWDDFRGMHHDADIREVVGKSLRSVAWSPKGDMLMFADASGIHVLLPKSIRPEPLLKEKGVNFVTWLPELSAFVFASESGELVFSRVGGRVDTQRFMVSRVGISSLATTRDGRRLASGTRDGLIIVWDVASRMQVAALEGHTDAVVSLSFSADGRLLASKSLDGTVRLWDTRTWRNVAVLDEPANKMAYASGIAFHPHRPDILATLDETGRGVRVWRGEPNLLLGVERNNGTIYFKSAKVLLLGDTASGKTSLARLLSEPRTRRGGRMERMPPATQGLDVGVLYVERRPMPDGGEEVREATVLDPAGELMNRLSENVRLGEVSLVLFVFYSLSESGARKNIARWDEELRRARTAQGVAPSPVRFLVETHADIEDVVRDPDDLESLAREFGFDDYFRTSVLTGEGVEELSSAVRGGIDWDALPGLVTTKLFEGVKAAVSEARREGVRLITVEELLRNFQETEAAPRNIKPVEFEVTLMSLERLGLLRKLDFGGLLLLRPEAFDSATRELVSAADDMGMLPEEEI